MLNLLKNVSPTELIFVVVLLTLLFGAKTVTRLGKIFGETVKEGRKVKNEFMRAINLDDTDDESQKAGGGEVSK